MSDQPTDKKWIGATKLCERWNDCSNMFIERKLQTDPDFPKPTKMGHGEGAWRMWALDEIEAYEKLCASRTAKARRNPRRRAGSARP
jgi:hypothetical protein